MYEIYFFHAKYSIKKFSSRYELPSIFFNKDPDQPFISEGTNSIQLNRFCDRNKVQLRTND